MRRGFGLGASSAEDDMFEGATETVAKYALPALPAQSQKGDGGATILGDIVDEILPPSRKRRLKRAV